MKKNLFLLFLIVVGLISISTLAIANEGYISTTENMTKELEPQIAEITFSVENKDKIAEKAVETNKQIADNVYTGVKILLENGDYIKTSEYSLLPNFSYKDKKRELDDYTVTNSITVRTKNLKLVSKIIDTAVLKGANKISNLRFITEDYKSACNEALAELSARAKDKANIVAKSVNSQLLGIKSITTNCSTENNIPYYTLTKSATNNSISTTTPISAGKVTIFAQVNAEFYVK